MSEFLSNFNQEFKPIDTFIDPVSKIRVSNPGNLIDTDFEYGLQPTKWETVELINNTPAFFSKSGDTTISDITGITTNAGTREITVTTAFPHLLDVGIPIRVAGTKSLTADGSYIINATPTPTTFTYLSRANEGETISIFDLYTSIITGEFFQGSQISVSDSEGIITDGASPNSTLTVKTSNKHGFGPKTPFYFLNLNSTVSKEFESQNSTSLSFDPTNSATAQSFDGSNTLIQTPIDISNSANTSIYANGIVSTDVANSTFTINIQTGDEENWDALKSRAPLYYEMNASSGYFATNSRGVVFIKDVSQIDSANNTATFQVSSVPDGDAIAVLSDLQGYFQIADSARTFAGNNINEESQILLDIIKEQDFVFDGANEDSVGSNAGANTTTVLGYAGETVNISGSSSLDYYVGAMLKFVTDGNAPGGLVNGATYFVTEFSTSATAGSYSMKLAELPNGAAPNISIDGSSATGSQQFEKIGVSVDRDIVHIKNSFFNQKDMIEYIFPGTGSFTANVQQNFYFISAAYDQHNYKLNNVTESFISATGGDVVQTVEFQGLNYTVHRFVSEGTFTFTINDAGTFEQDIRVVNIDGSFDGNTDSTYSTLAAQGSYTVVVNSGGRVDIAYPETGLANEIPFNVINPIPLTASGGTTSDIDVDGVSYRLHRFTNVGSSSFTVQSLGNTSDTAPSAEVLIVAGGGGGGSGIGGGGGGGGGVISTTQVLEERSYPVTVGNGGNGGNPSSNGGNSVFDSFTAIGGGRGGYNTGWNSGVGPSNGGSGGGGSGWYSSSTGGGSGTPGQGFDGGNGRNFGSRMYKGAGGGGAGGQGQDAQSTKGGDGGPGIANSITGQQAFYAGGGGGSVYSEGSNPSVSIGGVGGGGNGSKGGPGVPSGVSAQNGEPNTGGGGGASGRNGGSGVVIVRYPLEAQQGGN